MVVAAAGVGILVNEEPEVGNSLLFGMEDLRSGIISPFWLLLDLVQDSLLQVKL